MVRILSCNFVVKGSINMFVLCKILLYFCITFPLQNTAIYVYSVYKSRQKGMKEAVQLRVVKKGNVLLVQLWVG